MKNPFSIFFNRGKKVLHEILPVGIVDGQPIYKTASFRNNVIDGYRKNEVVYSCIKYITNSLAQVDLMVVNSKGEKIPNHMLKELLNKPSPYTSQYDFLSMIVIDLALSGEAYFEKVRSASGRVVQLWRLRPDFIRPVPTKNKFISHYEYDNGASNPVNLPEEDVVRFCLFDPINPYSGLATITPAGRVGDVDNATVDWIKKLFDSGGIPSGFLSIDRPVDDKQAKEYADKWTARYSGSKNWHRPAVLGMGATYKQLGLDFDKMAMKDIDAKTISRVCMVFGVNPILIGAAHGLSNSTFNNFNTAKTNFWEERLIPELKRILFTLNNQLVADEFPNVSLDWDLANVSALQVDRNKLWIRAARGLNSGGITVNEYRHEIGLPAVRGGDIFLRKINQAEIDAPVIKSIDINTEIEYKALLEDAPDKEDRLQRENEMVVVVQKFLSGQNRRILGTVEKKGKDDAFWENEDKLFYAVMSKELLTSGQISVENTISAFMEKYTIGIEIDLANGKTAKWVKKYSAELIKDINKRTRNEVREIITTWVNNELPRQALIDELTPLFGETRSKTIARTENNRAFFEGNRATWSASGMVNGWTWRTSIAEAPCPICGPLEGQEFELKSSYTPPAHPNCNCWAEAIVDIGLLRKRLGLPIKE
jgi:HK97 family phage portal protein